MSARLPADLVERLDALLGDELSAFLATTDASAVRGLRLNTRKADPDLVDRLELPLTRVSWCPTGYRFATESSSGLGDSLAHRAGLYYLQEPSAMAPAELLAHGLGAELAGARVIDLAAAPGGKTTRLVELVGPDGLVVANEIERKRLATLHENLDRWGASNVVTVSRPVEVLADHAAGGFDAVLLDAPCSGEGMFRRDPQAIRHWSPAAVRGAARRQSGLLTAAARLVRPGGVLVYSTCTFAIEENEERIAELLDADPDWTVEDARIDTGFASGVRLGDRPTDRTARLWPHRIEGEGHFAALLRLDPDAEPERPTVRQHGKGRGKRREPVKGEREVANAWADFREDRLADAFADTFSEERIGFRGDRAFLAPAPDLPFDTELLARPGVPLGRAKPGRFEPAQALAGLLSDDQLVDVTALDLSHDDPRWGGYLSGAELPDDGPDGWVLVRAYGWGLGWARRRGGVLKNFLPVGLRSANAARRW